MMRTLSLYLVVIITLVSCERYEDVEIDNPHKPKIVTACFLQGQSSEVLVAVTRSQPIFDIEPASGMEPTPTYIVDATVELVNGSKRYTLSYDSDLHLYKSDLDNPIKAGETYELSVTSNNVQSKGSTTIPGIVRVNSSLRFDSTLMEEGLNQYIAYFTCSPKDPGKHYIDFLPVLVYSDSGRHIMYADEFSTIAELNQGQSITKRFVSSFSAMGIYPVRMEMILISCDEVYGRNATQVIDLMNGGGLIPFTDPAITYSNMTNGIGSFGSYNPETYLYFNLK